MNEKQFIDYILRRNGKNQVTKAVEELEELALAFTRWSLAEADQSEVINNIHEELADVVLMLRQMEEFFGIGELEIETRIQGKIDRYFAMEPHGIVGLSDRGGNKDGKRVQ